MVRRLRQNARKDLNMIVVFYENDRSGVPIYSRSSRGGAPACCSGIPTVADHQFSTLQTIENLNLAVSSQARLDEALCKVWRSVVTQAAIVPSARGPRRWPYRSGFNRPRTRITKLGSMPGRSSSLGSVISERIVTRCVFGSPSHKSSKPFLEGAIREGHHLHGDRLSQLKGSVVTFRYVGKHPLDRKLATE